MFFSIIIPAYNVGKYIDNCLKSLVAQSFKDFEVIVIDDESNDDTYKLASSYSYTDDRFIIKKIKHVTVGEVRNCALDIANGDYIVFVDADDYIEVDMLKRIHDFLDFKHTDILFLPNHYVDTPGMKVNHSLIPGVGEENFFFESREKFFDFLLEKKGTIPASMWTGVCSKSVIAENEIRMDKGYVWSQDSDFMYQVLSHSKTVAICGYRGYCWNRKNVDSSTRNVTDIKMISRMAVYKKWYEALEQDCFGKISEQQKVYLQKSLLKNYCDVLFDYSFMKNKAQVLNVKRAFESDGLLSMDKTLVPWEYNYFGTTFGRVLFKYMHYAKELIDRVRRK